MAPDIKAIKTHDKRKLREIKDKKTKKTTKPEKEKFLHLSSFHIGIYQVSTYCS